MSHWRNWVLLCEFLSVHPTAQYKNRQLLLQSTVHLQVAWDIRFCLFIPVLSIIGFIVNASHFHYCLLTCSYTKGLFHSRVATTALVPFSLITQNSWSYPRVLNIMRLREAWPEQQNYGHTALCLWVHLHIAGAIGTHRTTVYSHCRPFFSISIIQHENHTWYIPRQDHSVHLV